MKLTNKQLINNFKQWARDRNLIDGSTPAAQSIKLSEEFGEVCAGISRRKQSLTEDGIGDCAVVLTIIAEQLGFKTSFDDVTLPNDIAKGKNYLPYLNMKIASLMLNAHAVSMPGFDDFDFECTCHYLVYVSAQQGCDFNDCLNKAWNEIKDRKGKMVDGIFVKEADL
ncbi:MazG-like family protein [Pasteurella multocida]